MFQKLSFAVLLLALGHIANGQLIFPGRCPDVNVVKDFDITKLAGDWYQQYSYPVADFAATKCTHAKYSVINDESLSIDITNAKVSSNEPGKAEGIATAVGDGALFARMFREGGVYDRTYKVIGYNGEYLVIYDCATNGNRIDYLYILTTAKHPSSKVLAAAVKHAADNHLFTAALKREDQYNCPA